MFNFTPGQMRVLREVVETIPEHIMCSVQKEEIIRYIPEVWEIMIQESEEKILEADTFQVLTKTIMLELSIMVASIDHEKGDSNTLFSSLLCTIANTMSAIELLGNAGFDYQAFTLLRILLEQYMILLTLTLHPSKRNSYCRAGNPDIARKVWHETFAQKKFFRLFDQYGEKYEEIAALCKAFVEKEYKELSSFVHTDYLNVLCFSYAPENGTENLKNNLFGQHKTRRETIYRRIAVIAFMCNILFGWMLKDEKVDISLDTLLDEKIPLPVKHTLEALHNVEMALFLEGYKERYCKNSDKTKDTVFTR